MKKRKIRNTVKLIVGVLVLSCGGYCLYRYMKPDIKNYSTGECEIIVYDDDVMTAERLRSLNCDEYLYNYENNELVFNTDDVESDRDYGKSFVMSIPVGFTKKNAGDNFELHYKVNYSGEAEKYIYVIQDGYISTDSEFMIEEKDGKWSVEVCGCNCNMNDEELAEILKSVTLSVEIVDSKGKEYDEEISLDLESLSVVHKTLEEDGYTWQSPFGIQEK